MQYHKLIKTMAKLYRSDYKLLQHLTYSLDLAFSDFFLFIGLKRMLTGKKSSTDKEVTAKLMSILRLKRNCAIKSLEAYALLSPTWDDIANLSCELVR